MGRPAPTTDRPAKAAAIDHTANPHVAFDPVAPGTEHPGTVRTRETPCAQDGLDNVWFGPYDLHSGAPASSGRALSCSGQGNSARGLLRVSNAPTIAARAVTGKPGATANHVHRTWRRQRDHQHVVSERDAGSPTGDQRASRSTPVTGGPPSVRVGRPLPDGRAVAGSRGRILQVAGGVGPGPRPATGPGQEIPEVPLIFPSRCAEGSGQPAGRVPGGSGRRGIGSMVGRPGPHRGSPARRPPVEGPPRRW